MAWFVAAAVPLPPVAAFPNCHPLRVEPSVFLMATLYIIWWVITRLVEEKHRSIVLAVMLVFLFLPYLFGPGLDRTVVSGCPDHLPTWVVIWRSSVIRYKTWMLIVYPVGILHDGAFTGHGTPKHLSPVFLIGFYYLFFHYYFGLLQP